MLKKNGLRFLWISMLVILVDWASKSWIQGKLALYDSIAVFPGFNLVLAYNRGAAFSFLNNSGTLLPNLLFGAFALAISAGILIWLYKLPRNERIISIACSLILGGALGNLWDRIRYQHVIDFIELYVYDWHWPAFNLADAAVCLGAFLLMWRFSKVK